MLKIKIWQYGKRHSRKFAYAISYKRQFVTGNYGFETRGKAEQEANNLLKGRRKQLH